MVFQKPNVNLEQSIWFLPKDALFDAAYIAELCNILALKKAYQKHLQENLQCKITPPGLLPLNHPLSMGLLLHLVPQVFFDVIVASAFDAKSLGFVAEIVPVDVRWVVIHLADLPFIDVIKTRY